MNKTIGTDGFRPIQVTDSYHQGHVALLRGDNGTMLDGYVSLGGDAARELRDELTRRIGDDPEVVKAENDAAVAKAEAAVAEARRDFVHGDETSFDRIDDFSLETSVNPDSHVLFAEGDIDDYIDEDVFESLIEYLLKVRLKLTAYREAVKALAATKALAKL